MLHGFRHRTAFFRAREAQNLRIPPAIPKSAVQPQAGIKWATLLLCVLLPILSSACTKQPADLPVGSDNSAGGFSWFGPEMPNTRFEVVGQESLNPSLGLWLRSGDRLDVRWDAYRLFWQADGATCNFSTLTTGSDSCERCNYCDMNDSINCRRHSLTEPPGDFETEPTVIKYDGFMHGANPTIVTQPSYLSGCRPGYPEVPPVPFTLTGNATFRILAPRFASYNTNRDDLNQRASPAESLSSIADIPPPAIEKKVHMVDTAQTARYQMTLDPTVSCDTAIPPNCKVWQRWTVGTMTFNGQPVWEDNFSNGLRVGKVTIQRGIPTIDPNDGMVKIGSCQNPDPVSGCLVRPSRIVFLADYDLWTAGGGNLLNHPDEGTHRCYADPNAVDGDIDLSSCRAPATVNFRVTPTIGDLVPMMGGVGKLSWFAEFNPCEGCPGNCSPSSCMTGATAPNYPGEIMIIEFTIQEV